MADEAIPKARRRSGAPHASELANLALAINQAGVDLGIVGARLVDVGELAGELARLRSGPDGDLFRSGLHRLRAKLADLEERLVPRTRAGLLEVEVAFEEAAEAVEEQVP